MKKVWLFNLFVLITTLSFTACADDAYTDQESATEIETRAGERKTPCFTLTYPVTLVFPDGTSAEVNSKEEAKEAKREYRKAGGERGRTLFSFPVEITLHDGSVHSVNSQDDIKALTEGCRAERNEDRESNRCSTLNFPVTVQVPNVGEQVIEDKEALRELKKTYREENGRTEERIELVYPYSLTHQDGTVMNITSDAERDALKELCGGDKQRQRRHRINRRG